MCVVFARTANGPDPLVARLAAELVALRQRATPHPGLRRFFQGATWLWAGIFLLLTAGLAVLMLTEPAGVFLMLSTVATIGLVIAGTGASAPWFLSALRMPDTHAIFLTAPDSAMLCGGCCPRMPRQGVRDDH
jgi:hypothetical protein